MQDQKIDGGKPFDWGLTSADYAKYRDIYPDVLYQTLYEMGIGGPGQRILDIGTGTGVLPRRMARYGACFTGLDLSKKQILQARALTEAEAFLPTISSVMRMSLRLRAICLTVSLRYSAGSIWIPNGRSLLFSAF